MEHIAGQLSTIPGVVAVTLGGSRATGAAVEGSDWDFGLYYRGRLDPADVAALGWPGRVFAPGEWGRVVNGGAWLNIDGVKVDLIYRDLDEVLRWTAAAEQGRFEIQREVGYVAGIATYVLVGELALGRVLAGELPRPEFPSEAAGDRSGRVVPAGGRGASCRPGTRHRPRPGPALGLTASRIYSRRPAGTSERRSRMCAPCYASRMTVCGRDIKISALAAPPEAAGR